jgi:hypothetical protein
MSHPLLFHVEHCYSNHCANLLFNRNSLRVVCCAFVTAAGAVFSGYLALIAATLRTASNATFG